jgi:Methyltransferase domain
LLPLPNERVVATSACMSELRRYPAGVIQDVMPGDVSYEEHNYLMLGRAALDAVRLAMLCAQKDSANRILDFASGYGRVLRQLRAEFPEAQLAACDIDHGAVAFCAEKFGALPIYGSEHPPAITETFDLLWCGSLLTHLDEPLWHEFLDFFEAAVEPGGLAVFSVAGREIARRLADPEFDAHYFPHDDERKRALLERAEDGFGFVEYPSQARAHSEPAHYGHSLVKPSWVWSLLERRPGWKVVCYIEDRWGGQDIVGAVRWQEGLRPFRQPLRHPNSD